MSTRHTDIVMSTLTRGGAVPGVTPVNAQIMASWERCVQEHHLEPHRLTYPVVYSTSELQDVKAPIEDLIGIASPEVDRLFSRLAEHHYVVTLTDAQGVVVMFRCQESMVEHCTSAGVLLGAKWSEDTQGTNGIGTCIREGNALSVVMDDHFGEQNVGLTCTVAPIFGSEGRLAAVLNVTTPLGSNHMAEALTRTILRQSARRIENRFFERRHASRPVLRISRHGDFSDTATELRVALDSSGKVVDATPDAIRLLSKRDVPLVGSRIPYDEDASVDYWAVDSAKNHAGVSIGGARLFVRPVETGTRRTRAVAPMTAPVLGTSPVTGPDVATLLGSDPQMVERGKLAQRLVDKRLPILLQGETGTGKSALAKALHQASVHRRGAFVSINCAAIPPELIESELFGYRPGSFTGAAKTGSRGRIAEADGGMLFLDEIGDMPLALQTRLLQVLSDGEFVPIGGTQPLTVRFALVSATLHDIASLVQQGKFRQDLYFRLNGATLGLSPLRQRLDRSHLIDRLFQEEGHRSGQTSIQLDATARQVLATYDWPGNIRELQHLVRYAVTLADDGHITARCLPPPLNEVEGRSDDVENDRRLLTQALEQTGWNVSLAAQRLRISRATLHRRITALGLARPDSST